MTAPVQSYQPTTEWPQAGDRMRFLGKNGYDLEREEARKLFCIGQLYTVEECNVQSWSHSVRFKEIAGWFNGVMFERMEIVPIGTVSDLAASLAAASARIEELERTVDLLESNARVQAKLLADTGRRAEAMEAALDAMRCDGCPPADRSTDKTSCKACPYRAGGALQSEKTT